MMTNTVRKFAVGFASAALVASAAAPAFAADKQQEVPGPFNGAVKTDRIGGYDRVETAIKIAEAAFDAEGKKAKQVAYLASAADVSAVDSAAAGHLSDGPIYLVDGSNRSSDAVIKSINDNFPNVQTIFAIGGEKAVAGTTLSYIGEGIHAKTDRLGGADRYATAVSIAKRGNAYTGLDAEPQFEHTKKVYLARGDNPVDALVSGVLDDAPVLLLGPDGTVPAATEEYLKSALPTSFVALGGEKAVPTASFLAADYDPVMKNVWTNNEAIKEATAAMAKAWKLLKGVSPTSTGLNPNVLSETNLTSAQRAQIEDALSAKETALNTANTNLTNAQAAAEQAQDDLDAQRALLADIDTKRAAYAADKTTATKREAFVAAAAKVFSQYWSPSTNANAGGPLNVNDTDINSATLADELATLLTKGATGGPISSAGELVAGNIEAFNTPASAAKKATFANVSSDMTQGVRDASQQKVTAANNDVTAKQAIVDGLQADVNALKAKLGGPTFMGYERIEKIYSNIDGTYANAFTAAKAAIDKRVSELVAAGTASQSDVAGDNVMQGYVAKAYGQTLNAGNVENFFVFKSGKVSAANHKKLAAENDDLYTKAVSLINTFYSRTSEGFDTGDMVSYFSAFANDSTKTQDEKNAALVIVNAVKMPLDSSKNLDLPNTVKGQLDSTYRVAHYLESVALENKKSAQDAYNKAKATLEALQYKIAGKRYDRVTGTDRYSTSAAIAAYWRAAYVDLGGLKNQNNTEVPPQFVYIANGESYIDAVAGGQLTGGPIVLAKPNGDLDDTVKQRFAFAKTDSSVLTIVALGGTGAVPDAALSNAKAAALDSSWLTKDLFNNTTTETK